MKILLFLCLGLASLLADSLQAATPAACEVESVSPVVPASAGFSVSPVDEAVVLYARPVEGISQIFRLDRRTKQDVCLTCQTVPGGPAANRHKGSPAFLPDGQRFVMQVQMARHPFEGSLGGPGAGWFNDVWMASADARHWWNLTRHPGGPADRYGVLLPEPSPDGSRIAWAEMHADDGERARAALKRRAPLVGGAPWGRWRIRVADLGTDPSGAPVLRDVRSLVLPHATWYETQGWSSDGRFLIFATDAGLATPQAMDLWIHDFATGQSANLTRSADAWEEFGDISPGGGLVAFMSSACCGFDPLDDKSRLRSELYLTSPDRAFTTRLTFFNERGHAHAKDAPGGSTVTKLRWSRDGTKIWFERPFYGAFGGARGSWLMELRFAGACGATPPAARAESHRPASAASANDPGPVVVAADKATDRAPSRSGVEVVGSASLEVGGAQRTYRLALPRSAIAPMERRPVIFAFHGFGDTKDLMPIYSGLDDLAARHGAIVVYPQSRPGAWPLVLDWAKPDLAFFDALVGELDRRHGIDRSRIYVTGMSNGAYFANLLASQRSSVIAAIATHSGGLGGLAVGDVPIARRYPVMIVHGAADAIVKVDEARKARAYYERRGHDVRYVELPGHNHFWARGRGINEQIWAFFAAHPLRQ